MRHEHYPFSSDEEGCFFEFDSIGPKGVIKKVVVLSFMSGNRWNLAFGDKIGGQLMDDVISNNNDLVKVMATVVQAAIVFSSKYPTRTLFIQPLDNRRRLLYNTIFKRYFEEFSTVFDVFGQIEDEAYQYDPVENYDTFFIRRK